MLEQKANVDLSMALLAGLPISVEGLGEILPLKLREIAEIGEQTFNQYLSMICIEIDQLAIEEEKKTQLKEQGVTSFLFILSQCLYDNSGNFLDLVLKSLKFFLKSEVIFSSDLQGFWIGEKDALDNYLIKKEEEINIKAIKILNNNNYEEFKQILKLQNGLDSVSDFKSNPADERTRLAIERMKKLKQDLAKAKSKEDGGNIGLIDLISSFIVSNRNLNSEQVWELTLFQFNNYFKRLQMMMEYEINIQSLLHGADSKKIELKHFISEMKE